MLLSYFFVQTNLNFYGLQQRVRGHSEAARHTQGFLPVKMDLQLPVLVEWHSHIHVACGGF